jgi:hypothetical protein
VDELFVHDVMAGCAMDCDKALHLSLVCLMIIHGVQVMAIANTADNSFSPSEEGRNVCCDLLERLHLAIICSSSWRFHSITSQAWFLW